jgi:gamma-glutamyltranspeptidase/glutathione hydrolase
MIRLLFLFWFGCIQSLYAAAYAVEPPGYAIASAHPLATNAGLEIIAMGGNAFDAAVAVSAVLAVVEPYHSGLGGGGFWLLHEEKRKKNIFIDSREVAPLAAHKDMFLGPDGKPVPGLSLNGALAAGIPGEPAALVYIASHYGRLSLAKSLAPAIRLAEEGFIVDSQFYNSATMADRLQMMQRFPTTAAVFLHEGKPYQIGERFKQPDLAKTLRLLAIKGHDGFYRGKIARQLVEAVRAAGGIWSLDDLANYKIKVRMPLVSTYHNMRIITAPPPSAGGVALITMLNILSAYPLQSLAKVKWVHYLVESMRLAYWQRWHIGDPDFRPVPVNTLISAKNAKHLREFILKNKATPSASLQGVKIPEESYTTTHFSIIDKEGNRVAATLSINFIFGSSFVAAGTGVLLNDEMDDFAIKPGEKNVFGLVGSSQNLIAPGKRPVSSMTPTFIEAPGRLAIIGTPGGSRIPSMILLAALDFENYEGAISMVSTMRFHHQYLPDLLQFEPESFSPQLQQELKEMGYQLMPLKQYYGDIQGITWDKVSNIVTAASDPRNIGLGVAITSTPSGYGLAH